MFWFKSKFRIFINWHLYLAMAKYIKLLYKIPIHQVDEKKNIEILILLNFLLISIDMLTILWQAYWKWRAGLSSYNQAVL